MDNPSLALILPALLIVPAMGLLSRIRSQGPVSAEIRRKALHLCAGAASLSFPAFLSDPRRVVAATLLMLAWMLAVRVVPVLQRRFGCVLHETDRSTHGELYFALGIAVLLLLPHANPLWYVAPVLVLTLADTAAAIVGRAMPIGALRGAASGKTWAGSLAFLVTAAGVIYLCIRSFTPLPVSDAIAISAIAAVSCCAVEALSSRGLDNLLIPATAWLVLFSLTSGA